MKGPVIRWIALIVILAEIAGIAAFFELPRLLSQVNSETAISSYQTAKVQKGDLTTSIGANGLVRSKQSAVLNWQKTGIVGLVNGARSQQVSADDVLAELKQSSLSQVIILARANLVSAQKNLDNLLNTNVTCANAELAVLKAQKALYDATKAQRSKESQVANQQTIDHKSG